MTSEELEAIVRNGESGKVEFKRTTGQLERGMETVCAFLYGDGGTVVFGVDDDWKLVGQLVSDDTRQKIGNAVGQISPAASMQIDYVTLANGQIAIVIEVPPQKENRPFLYKSRAYRRLQTTTSPMPPDMYSDLFVGRVSGTYVQRGDPGTHTRRIGLVAEECKELIRKHLRLCGKGGAPSSDFDDLLSGTPKRRIRYFLKQMQDAEEIRREGRSVAARWYLRKDIIE